MAGTPDPFIILCSSKEHAFEEYQANFKYKYPWFITECKICKKTITIAKIDILEKYPDLLPRKSEVGDKRDNFKEFVNWYHDRKRTFYRWLHLYSKFRDYYHVNKDSSIRGILQNATCIDQLLKEIFSNPVKISDVYTEVNENNSVVELYCDYSVEFSNGAGCTQTLFRFYEISTVEDAEKIDKKREDNVYLVLIVGKTDIGIKSSENMLVLTKEEFINKIY